MLFRDNFHAWLSSLLEISLKHPTLSLPYSSQMLSKPTDADNLCSSLNAKKHLQYNFWVLHHLSHQSLLLLYYLICTQNSGLLACLITGLKRSHSSGMSQLASHTNRLPLCNRQLKRIVMSTTVVQALYLFDEDREVSLDEFGSFPKLQSLHLCIGARLCHIVDLSFGCTSEISTFRLIVLVVVRPDVIFLLQKPRT